MGSQAALPALLGSRRQPTIRDAAVRGPTAREESGEGGGGGPGDPYAMSRAKGGRCFTRSLRGGLPRALVPSPPSTMLSPCQRSPRRSPRLLPSRC